MILKIVFRPFIQLKRFKVLNQKGDQNKLSQLIKLPEFSQKDDLQVIQDKFQHELDVIFEEDEKLLTRDYTQSPSVVKFQKSDSEIQNDKYESNLGLTLNTSNELQLKDNPLALKILTEKQIDFSLKEINVISLNIQQQDMFDNKIQGQLRQIDLGKIIVNPKDSILLEDVDVLNIPEDKDIILIKNEKILQAIGIKVEKKKGQGEKEGEKHIMEISKNIFEEFDYNYYYKKYIWAFEGDMVHFDYREFLRWLILRSPFYVVFYFFYTTLKELYFAKHDVNLMEQQEMETFQKFRNKYVKKMLTDDTRFDRKKIFDQQ